MMNYVILDMEWNQPFSADNIINKPVKLAGEIIQIGAVKLDDKFNYCDNFKIAVRPKFYKKINRYVKKLTKINNEDMNNGVPFLDAFKLFSDWCGDDFVFLTWGADDIPMLKNNMLIHNINPDWIPIVYNLQIIFCSQKFDMFRQVSLTEAALTVNEELLDAHDALNDSMSTHMICKHLDLKKGILNYEKDYLMMIGKKYESEIIDELYNNKKEALSSNKVKSFLCPECGKKIFCNEIVRQTKGKSITIAKCKKGENFFVKFRFIPKKGGKISICRSVRTLNRNNEALYYQKKALQEQTEKNKRCVK